MGLLSNAAIALDPSLMMVKAGMSPDPWQQRILRKRPQRSMLNCTRQSGKTTVISAQALHEALYYAPALVLIVSPSERQSKEMLQVIGKFRQAMGVSVDPENESTTRISFRNGSRIIALPSKEQNLRGFAAVKLLIIDEASRVPDELYHAVKPMLAVSNGRMSVLSTPFGKRGFFYNEWMKSVEWEKVMVKAHECPRITPAFLAQEKASLPDSWFRQEYMCEFAETDGAIFPQELIDAAMSDDVTPLFPLLSAEDSGVKPLFPM